MSTSCKRGKTRGLLEPPGEAVQKQVPYERLSDRLLCVLRCSVAGEGKGIVYFVDLTFLVVLLCSLILIDHLTSLHEI